MRASTISNGSGTDSRIDWDFQSMRLFLLVGGAAMATSLQSTLFVQSTWNYEDSRDLSTPKDQGKLKHDVSWTDGTSDDQVDVMWSDRRCVTSSTASDDIDLAGSLVDVFGNTITFAKIKKIVIENLGVPTVDQEAGTYTPTAGEDILIGNGGANSFNDIFNGVDASEVKLGSGGIFAVSNPIDGWTVTAGTADILRIAHDGTNDICFKIVIEGTTA